MTLVKFKSNHTIDGVQYLRGEAVEIEDDVLKRLDPADYKKTKEEAAPEEKAPEAPKENKAVDNKKTAKK